MIYILIMNVIGFCLMGLDKHRARTRQWRVPEKILFGAALLGGSAGAWAGMYDIALESSTCTGETVIGFRSKADGHLLNAVVVRSRSDIETFYKSYGFVYAGKFDK